MQKDVPHSKVHLFINEETLSARKIPSAEIEKLNAAMQCPDFWFGFVFNVYTLGEACLQRLGFWLINTMISPDGTWQSTQFTDEEIEAA